MSSYYIFDEIEGKTTTVNPGGVKNPMTKNLNAGKYMITNIKTYPQNDTDVCSKKYVSDEDKKLLPLDGSRVMTDDIDLGGNTCIGVGLISARNSTVPRSYIDNHFVSKTSKTTMLSNLNMNGYFLENLPTPTNNKHAATKKYIDDKTKSLNTRNYTYALGFDAFPQNSWKYGAFPSNSSPHGFMYCDGLQENSTFSLLTHSFDNDNSIPNPAPFEYRLDVFDSSGAFKQWKFMSTNIKNYQIPGEPLVCFSVTKYFKDFPNADYKKFKVCRLAVRRTFSGTFGNESNVVFAINI